jgi:hypothetical protein
VRTIIAGSRELTAPYVVERAIQTCPFASRITEVICGGAKGVDCLGDHWALKANLPVKYFLIRDQNGKIPMRRLVNAVRGVNDWAGDLGEPVEGWSNVIVASDWGVQGHAAGPIRNAAMAAYADALIAIPLIGKSRGTSSMIGLAQGRDLKIHINGVMP